MLFILLGIIVVVGALLLIFSNFSTGKKRNPPRTAPPRTEDTDPFARADKPDEKVIYLFGSSKKTDTAGSSPKTIDPEDENPEDDEA